MARTEISKNRERGASSASESLIDVENAELADADIYETDDSLFVKMDLPGVEKGSVQIEVDESNTLQVRAKNSFQEPKGALSKEFEVADYFRSFRLGEEFDKDNIHAKLENGTLELIVAKKEEVKPRRIEIKA
jgi:HSP20 family protein